MPITTPNATCLPLPKRFSAALTEEAYARLREMNGRYGGLSNNYLLTVLLENLDDVTDRSALDAVYKRFIDEYGAPEARTGKVETGFPSGRATKKEKHG